MRENELGIGAESVEASTVRTELHACDSSRSGVDQIGSSVRVGIDEFGIGFTPLGLAKIPNFDRADEVARNQFGSSPPQKSRSWEVGTYLSEEPPEARRFSECWRYAIAVTLLVADL